MAEFKKQQSFENRDYKERFSFEFKVGDNIIVSRYFKIANFNPLSLRSLELTNVIRNCKEVIDAELKDKTKVYLEIYAPANFETEDEMYAYYETHPNEAAKMHIGEGIVVRSTKKNYYWAGDGVIKELDKSNYFDDGELTTTPASENKMAYTFTFKDGDNTVCAIQWDGLYPKFVRDKIDLTNKRGKFEKEDIDRLSFEQYLLYKMAEGRKPLEYGLIKDICGVCSCPNDYYTVNKNKIFNDWSEANLKADKVFWGYRKH